MQSNGGLISPDLARDFPVRIIESGPAAGILMCAIVGKQEGRDQIITFDMGGTTAKLGAIDDGVPAIMPTFEVDLVRYKKGSGLPINVPAVEMIEIGAGGGSIARDNRGHDCRRPRQRRRRPRTHLLWPWRPRANHHRCQCGAGIHFARLVQWRHHAPRQGGSRPRHQARDRRSARRIHGGSGLGYPSRRDIQHGERAAHRLGRAGSRSASLHHGGVWWRRTASRRAARARGRHTDGHRALWRRRRLRHRTASGGATHRRHAHQGHAPRCETIRPRDCGRLHGARSSGETGRENGSRKPASRNGPATRRCDMPGKGSRSMSIFRRAR